MNLHLTHIPAKLRGELDEAIDTLAKGIKTAQRCDGRAAKLEADFANLDEEHAKLAGQSSLSDAEAGRLNILITRRASLQSSIELMEADLAPARQKLHTLYSSYNTLLGRLARLLSDQMQKESEAAFAPYFLPLNIPPIVAQSDLLNGMTMRCMRAQYVYPNTLAETVRWATETLNILGDFAAGRPIYVLQPEAPTKAV